jgi:uncharacterized delta-60 repeat protein
MKRDSYLLQNRLYKLVGRKRLINMSHLCNVVMKIIFVKKGAIMLLVNTGMIAVFFVLSSNIHATFFNVPGTINPAFGPNGTGFTTLGFGPGTSSDIARAMVLDSQGRILLGGQASPSGFNDFALARFTSDGIVDTSFGPDGTGFTTLNVSGGALSDIAHAIVVDSQGRILLGGQVESGAPTDFALAQFFGQQSVSLAAALRTKYRFTT